MKVGPLTLRGPASAVDATAGRGYMDWPGEPQRFWEIYLAQSWALDLGVSEILIRDQSLRSYTAINPSYSCNCFLWKHVETALKNQNIIFGTIGSSSEIGVAVDCIHMEMSPICCRIFSTFPPQLFAIHLIRSDWRDLMRPSPQIWYYICKALLRCYCSVAVWSSLALLAS